MSDINDRNGDGRILDAYLRRPTRGRLTQVVRVFHRHVWDVAVKVAGNRQDAADVSQDFFLSLLLHPPAPGSVRSAHGYIACRVITISRTLRRAARRRLLREQKAAASCLDVETLSSDQSNSLQAALESLPERLQTVVELVYFGRMSQDEVAQLLELSPRSVAADLQKAKAHLRERLGGAGAALLALPAAESTDVAPPPGYLKDLQRLADLGWALAPGAAEAATTAARKKGLLAALAGLFIFSLLTAIFLARLPLPAVTRSSAKPLEARTEPVGQLLGPSPAPLDSTEVPVESVAPAVEAAAEENPYGSLLVRVRWAGSGLPAEGIGLRVIPWRSPDLYLDDVEGVTGPEGTFRVERVYRGRGTVYLDRGGSEYFEVDPTQENEVLLEVRAGINVRGDVVDSRGDPVAGARVWMSYGGNLTVGQEVTTTGTDGTFEVPAVGKGTSLGARAKGYGPSDLRAIEGEIGSTVTVRLEMSGWGGSVSGTVLDPEGRPVTGAIVLLGREEPLPRLLADGVLGRSPPSHRVRTDDSGRFLVDTLSSGEMEVSVRAPGLAPFSTLVEVRPRGRVSDLTIVLEQGGTIWGTVRDDQGEIAPARVVVGDWRKFLSVKTSTGPSGKFRLRGVPSGRVLIHADGHQDGALKGKASAWLDIAPGAEIRWDPVLSRSLQVAGKVVDRQGSPLAGWTVQAEEVVGDLPRLATAKKAASGPDGAFAIDDLCELDYLLTVFEPGSMSPALWMDRVVPSSEELVISVPDEARATSYLSGIVVDKNGEAVPDVLVSVYRFDPRSTVRLDERNSFLRVSQEGVGFKLGPLPSGLYWIGVEARGREALAPEERELFPHSVLHLGTIWLDEP